MEYFFGKVGGRIFILLITWFAFDLCSIVLRNYGQFVVTVGLPETPLSVAMFILMIVCVLTVRRGIEVIGRWTENFLLYVLAFLLIGVLLVSPNMNIDNLLPAFDTNIGAIAKGAFGVTTFPFAETVVFLLVFPALQKGVSAKKIFTRGLYIGGGVILITSLSDMLVLGTTAAESMYYPTYSAMSNVHFGDFLQRFEIIAAIVFITAVFLKISILLLGTCKGAAYLLGLKSHQSIVMPIAFLVINTAIFSFDSMIYFHEWTFSIFPYYASVFQIIVPLIALIMIEIKIHRSKKAAVSSMK